MFCCEHQFRPDNSRGIANRVVQFSGTTVESFNNYGNGSQDFSVATINSSRTGESFNNLREGSQTFRGAEIRCVDDSSGKRTIASLFTRKRDHVAHHAILHSFNNAGNGSQKFDDANINCGRN
ncbi:hypothetical protein E2542_SST16721 [Spatholobus suberectus]|nr:hypothetical protein E2542_SST16721 [Spatholobus suberectus]